MVCMENIDNKKRIAVIGAGNGGCAIAGHLAMMGHEVVLYSYFDSEIEKLRVSKTIELTGVISGVGKLHRVTSNIEEAICNAEIIMIVTIANVHGELAKQMSRYLSDGQLVVLNPGRTGGAIEFKVALDSVGFDKKIYLAEAQTLIYACRLAGDALVNIIGMKERVMLSTLPASDTSYVLKILSSLYHCFIPVENVLVTSLENIGAIFHPCVVLFNAATIERGTQFYFYRDMTRRVAEFIEMFDKERINVGKAYGIELMPVKEWISYSYDKIEGETLLERMRNNPAYYNIKAPVSIESRQLLEDIPTGLVPIFELGQLKNVDMPLFQSIIRICSTLLGKDFITEGRTLKKMGIDSLSDVFKIIG